MQKDEWKADVFDSSFIIHHSALKPQRNLWIKFLERGDANGFDE
jgi:hypothetical protein